MICCESASRAVLQCAPFLRRPPARLGMLRGIRSRAFATGQPPCDPAGKAPLSSLDRASSPLLRLLTTAACLCAATHGFAQVPNEATSLNDLNQMSLTQLTSVQVTSVSKQPQTLLQAASAIQVITSEDIRRYGATSLPQALRLADNLEVAQINANEWAISARGFNAHLADKLLVLIDGRAVYTPLYGGVLWNVQDYPLQDIDRIEVISGPGGTLWGANAVNGVINIITKSAADTRGPYVQLSAGNVLEGQASVRYGGVAAGHLNWRAYAQYTGRGDELTATHADADDASHMGRTGFRMDSGPAGGDLWTLQSDAYDGTQDAYPAGEEHLSGANILGRWTRTASAQAGMSLQFYFDHSFLALPYAVSPPTPPYYSGFPTDALTDSLDTYDMSFQRQSTWRERQSIVWGLGYRFTHEADHDLNIVRFVPPIMDQSLYNGFVQDAISLPSNVTLTLGSKLEHNSYTGFEVEPNVRLQWNPDGRQLVWTAVSRAVRTPARYDRDLAVPTGLINAPAPYVFPTYYLTGSGDFISETLIAYEAGYRIILDSQLSASLSAYYNNYDHLRSTTATATTATYPFPFPIYFQNNLEGETHGLELTGTYRVLDWWQVHAGYDLLIEDLHVKPGQMDSSGAGNETADPRNQLSFRSSLNLPHGIAFDATLRWIDTLELNNGPTSGPALGTVPAYDELDCRLAWQVSSRLALSIVGHNLLHSAHVEYGYPSPTREQIARSVFGRIAWGY